MPICSQKSMNSWVPKLLSSTTPPHVAETVDQRLVEIERQLPDTYIFPGDAPHREAGDTQHPESRLPDD